MRSFLLPILLLLALSLSGQEKELQLEDDLGDVSDDFQEYLFEALKQKGIENYELALDALRRAEGAAGEDPQQLAVVLFERGKNLAQLQRYQEAEDSYLAVLDRMGRRMDVLEALYDVYYEQRDYEKALGLVEELSERDQDYKEDLANLYFRTQRFEQALELLDELDLLWGESTYRNSLRRQVYQATGDSEGAISNLEQKIEGNKKNEQDYLNLIYLYSEQGNLEKAFETALELERNIPRSELVHLALYKFYLDKGNSQEAMTSMNKVFSARTIDDSSKFKVLEDYLGYLSDHPEMQDGLDKVIDQFTDSAEGEVYEQLGGYFLGKGNREAALTFYQKGAKRDPDNFSLLKNTLLLLVDVKDFEAASELSESGLQIFPAQPLLYLLNGVARIELGQTEVAIERLTEGLDYLFDDPQMEKDFYLQLQLAYQLRGDKEKASDYGKKAEAIKPDN
jgi:tetratricopeptide (TPR) repeat protein